MQVMHHKVHGDFKMPAWPVRVNGQPSTVVASPILGEHTGEVLRSWLDMTDPEVAALRSEGAV